MKVCSEQVMAKLRSRPGESDLVPDFLGAFAILEREGSYLFVQNERRIGGRVTRTWDLPGGQVESGELLEETLARELGEETKLVVTARPLFAFFQEGERREAGRRLYTWRSFFFRISAFSGEPSPGAEVLAVRWIARQDLAGLLTAPYHDSFLHWVQHGGTTHASVWEE